MGAESGNQIKEASPPTHRSPPCTYTLGCVLYHERPRGHICGYPTQQSSSSLTPQPTARACSGSRTFGTGPHKPQVQVWGHLARGSFILGTWNMEGGGCRLWVDMSLGISEHFIPRGCYAHGQGKSSHYPDLRAVLVLLEHTWYIVNALSVGRMRERDREQEIE